MPVKNGDRRTDTNLLLLLAHFCLGVGLLSAGVYAGAQGETGGHDQRGRPEENLEIHGNLLWLKANLLESHMLQ